MQLQTISSIQSTSAFIVKDEGYKSNIGCTEVGMDPVSLQFKAQFNGQNSGETHEKHSQQKRRYLLCVCSLFSQRVPNDCFGGYISERLPYHQLETLRVQIVFLMVINYS